VSTALDVLAAPARTRSWSLPLERAMPWIAGAIVLAVGIALVEVALQLGQAAAVSGDGLRIEAFAGVALDQECARVARQRQDVDLFAGAFDQTREQLDTAAVADAQRAARAIDAPQIALAREAQPGCRPDWRRGDRRRGNDGGAGDDRRGA